MRAQSDLIAESHKNRITRILETAPGLGPIRVAQLVSIVVTPHRFRTKRQFWSYCGLSIVMRSSSDWMRTPEGGWIRGRIQQTRGLTRQHNHILKEIFKSAATTVVTHSGTYALYEAYRRMTESGTKPNLAKVTLARMIAAIVLRMWKDEEPYQPRHTVESRAAAQP
jgi:transposase